MNNKIDLKNTDEYLIIEINKEKYGVDVQIIKEVIRIPEITHVPGAKSDVLGIINLRGKIISILNADKKLKITERISFKDSWIIIIDYKKDLVGILADNVIEVLKISINEIEKYVPLTKKCTNEIIEGVYTKHGEFFIILNAIKLIENIIEDI